MAEKQAAVSAADIAIPAVRSMWHRPAGWRRSGAISVNKEREEGAAAKTARLLFFVLRL